MEKKKCNFKRIFLVLLSWIALLFLSLAFLYLFISLENNIYLLVIHCILILFLSLCFLRASLMDPGYYPVGFPNEYDKEIEPKGFKPPMVKDVIINSISTKLKWCLTCKIYRPPRVSHCSICQRCVDIFDHHCPWINNCVGKRNYRCFFMFLISTVVHGYFSLIRSVLIIINKKDEILTFYPVFAIVLVCLTLVFLLPLTGLACFHIFLISNARTTNEHVTSKFIDGMNPYDRGYCWNIFYFLCRTEYPRFRYLPGRSLKTYPDFFRVNEKLGEQKRAVIDELRGKLKRTDMTKVKLYDKDKSLMNKKNRMTDSFTENKRPVVPPYTETPLKKAEKVIPPIPPHGSNRLSSTSHQTTIVIPPSVPPHRSQSNSHSETSSTTRLNTPVYHHNISAHDVTLGSEKDDPINMSCPNVDLDNWPKRKSSISQTRLSTTSTTYNTSKSSQLASLLGLFHQDQEADDQISKTAIIQRPLLNIKSRPSISNNNNNNNNQNQPPITFLNSQKNITGSLMTMSQRNRLISNGRLAQFENQSPPPEGTVEISI